MGCCGTGLLCTHWRAVADGGLGSIDGVVAVLEVLQLLRSMARPLPNAPTRGGVSVVGVGRASVCGRAPRAWLSAFRLLTAITADERPPRPLLSASTPLSRLHHRRHRRRHRCRVRRPPSLVRSSSPPETSTATSLDFTPDFTCSRYLPTGQTSHSDMCVDHGRWSLRPIRCSVPLATSQPAARQPRTEARSPVKCPDAWELVHGYSWLHCTLHAGSAGQRQVLKKKKSAVFGWRALRPPRLVFV